MVLFSYKISGLFATELAERTSFSFSLYARCGQVSDYLIFGYYPFAGDTLCLL
ncbi:MAG: hypothetical protein HQK83_08385 [Fibrobacteria bacterium]|nr:hypothetical protein [Fibrobacteria bacterium]